VSALECFDDPSRFSNRRVGPHGGRLLPVCCLDVIGIAVRPQSGDHDLELGRTDVSAQRSLALLHRCPPGTRSSYTAGAISPWPLIRKGDQQHPVKTLQYLLPAHGHNVTVDGIFGPNTDAAVRAFQQQKGPGRRRHRRPQHLVGPHHYGQARQPGATPSAGSRRSSSSATCPATPARDWRSTKSSAPRPTPPSAASSRPSTRTCHRSPSTASSSGHLAGARQRDAFLLGVSVGRRAAGGRRRRRILPGLIGDLVQAPPWAAVRRVQIQARVHG
jgi:hypothetical protein